MSADNRSVHTDALVTLGTIITPKEKRDAIHLEVILVKASERLLPGDHITVVGEVAYPSLINQGVGIVDPFLTTAVAEGETFWCVIYPRKITSLRHVWSHPYFEDETNN